MERNADEEDGWMIFKAGRGWYRPNAQGYTMDHSDAGRYSWDDAWKHSHPNGLHGPRDGMTMHHESDKVDLRNGDQTTGRTAAMHKTGDLVMSGWKSCPDHMVDFHSDEGCPVCALIAERDAAFALGVGAAAEFVRSHAVLSRARISPLSIKSDPPLTTATAVVVAEQNARLQTDADRFDVIAHAILNLATTTPLQAALALPEVRELVEALKKRDVVRACTTTGGPNHEGQRWVHWADYQELRQRIDNALAKLEAKG